MSQEKLEKIASPYLSTGEAACYLLISEKTLKNHRSQKTGPKFRRHGGKVVYHRKDLDLWSESRSIRGYL